MRERTHAPTNALNQSIGGASKVPYERGRNYGVLTGLSNARAETELETHE